MRYVIYGAGGIGGGIGAQLHMAGFDVVLIARGEHFRKIRGEGVWVLTPDSKHLLQIPTVSHPRDLHPDPESVVMLTMKSQDTGEALLDLRASVGSGVPVVCAQNGVANEHMASRLFERVYGLLVHMPATFLEPGTVILEGTPIRGALDAGCYPRGADELIEGVCSDLEAAGFSSRPEPEIMKVKYGKLLMNLGNAVQALCGLDADIAAFTKKLRKEAMACFDAAGIEFITARELVERSAGRYSLGEVEGAARQGGSTWQSLERGRRSIEADFFNGEICLVGAQHGVPTPYNRAVQDLATEAARDGERPGGATVEEIEDRAAQLR